MNLNEAAETMRRYYDPKDQFDGPCGTAPGVLQLAMLSELDPTPITEEWLAANGWVEIVSHWRFGNDSLLLQRCREVEGVWFTNRTTFDITTIGELRTLLRLCGAPKKENDA